MWGEKNELTMLMEEFCEAATAAGHLIREREGAREELIEELADASMMMESVIQMLDAEKEFEQHRQFKIERMYRRLEKGINDGE